MAFKLFRCIAALAFTLTWCLATAATPVRAASASDTLPTKYHHLKFYLDPAVLTDMAFAKAVLPKYVADMNLVLGKNTQRQLMFDAETDILMTSTKPETDSAAPPLPTNDFDIWAYAMPSSYLVSYGGFASVDVSGAGVLAGMHWTRLYDPDQLATAADVQDYTTQIDNMLHELAHVFGAGIGEYYSLSRVTDTTQVDPLLNITVTAPGDPYWSDKPDFLGDPLLQLNRAPSRARYLAAARYSDLTAAIMNGDYRNGVPSFNSFVVRVVDAGAQPVSGAEVKVWNVSGKSPYASQLLYDEPTDENGQLAEPWGGVGNAHTATNLLRLVKVYQNGVPYTPARYFSIFDADIAQLVKGQSELVVVMQPANQPPTDIALSGNAIDENQPAGSVVGELTASDADPGEVFSFRFCGGADDESFQLSGSQLLSAVPFDSELKHDYSVCVQADDGRGGLLDKTFSIELNDLPDTTTVSIPSMPVNDGWVRETGKSSNQGGTLNATATSLLVGNDASNRRYRSVLAFNTSNLPEGAIITHVTLRIRKQSVTGGDPFSLLGKLVVDVGKPLIGSAAALQSVDFQAGAGTPGAGVIGRATDSQGWYSVELSRSAYGLVGSAGTTELRLRFNAAGNTGTAYVSLYSGNAAIASRPVLLVEYELP